MILFLIILILLLTIISALDKRGKHDFHYGALVGLLCGFLYLVLLFEITNSRMVDMDENKVIPNEKSK